MKTSGWILALLPPLLSGCLLLRGYDRPQPVMATSYAPWGRSACTGLPLWPAASALPYPYQEFVGWSDRRVLAVHTLYDSLPYQSVTPDPQLLGVFAPTNPAGRRYAPGHLPPGLDKLYYPSIIAQRYVTPGTVWLFDIALAIDEAEVSNVEWQHFLNRLAADSASPDLTRYLPQTSQLPRPDYFTNPFYRYYPVVGIRREQAEAYCRWRSAATTDALAALTDRPTTDPDYLVMRYRLPTEAEWEFAAGRYKQPEQPYGFPGVRTRLQVNPKAAAYLAARSGTTKPAREVARDIAAFNRVDPKVVQFNCRREVPYFLALPTPGYVFDLPQNAFGLYHIIGNVAELVQEPGLTKGGSYRDSLAACAVRARGRYAGPAPDLGFRCVCEISFPNRH